MAQSVWDRELERQRQIRLRRLGKIGSRDARPFLDEGVTPILEVLPQHRLALTPAPI
jgi:hypothetical protein